MANHDPAYVSRLKGGGDPTNPFPDPSPRELAARVRRAPNASSLDVPEVQDIPRGGKTFDLGPSVNLDALLANTRTRAETPRDVVKSYELNKLYDRDWWHSIETPERIEAMWNDVEEAIEQVEHYELEWERYDQEERRAIPAADRKAYEAIKAGLTPPEEIRLTDYTAAKNACLTNMAAGYRVAQEARYAYNAAVREELPAWREAIIATLPGLQPAAREKWQEFRTAFGRWRTPIDALIAMRDELGEREPEPNRRCDQDMWKAMHAGFGAIDGLLGSVHPIMTGMWATDPIGMEPPMWIRWQWAQEPRCQEQLRRIEQRERDEGQTFSTFLVP